MSEIILTDFLEASEQPGCPICRVTEQVIDAYLQDLVKAVTPQEA